MTGGLSFEEFHAMCVAQPDRAACESADGFEDHVNAVFGGCIWETWASVQVGEDGSCSFGTPTARCTTTTGSTVGCAGPSVACWADELLIQQSGAWRMDAAGVELGAAAVCTGFDDAELCRVDEEGVVLEGPAECACLCNESWPHSDHGRGANGSTLGWAAQPTSRRSARGR